MQNHQKLGARILSLLLTAALVGTMLPATVFAAEGPAPLVATARTTPLDLATNADITYIGTDGTTPKTANPTTTSITDTGEGWSWNLGTKTLTLSGANITNTETATPTTPERPEDLVSYLSYGIILPSGSTIELTENTENTITGGNIDTSSDLTTGDVLLESAGVCVDETGGDKAALTIKGKGTLNATGGTLTTGDAVSSRRRSTYSYGITSSDSLNIKGGTVSATGGDVTANSNYPQAASYGISSAYNITVDDAANVTATGGYAEGTFKARGSNNAGFADSYGIDVSDNIAITSSTVNAIGGAATHKDVDGVVEGYPSSTGISNGLSTTINGGTVTAHAVHTGIDTMENITINNGSTVVADGTYFGITTQMALSIEDSTVTASGLDESAEMGFGILSPDISIKSGNVIAQGTILAMACLGEDGPGAGITIADGATIVGSKENDGTPSAAEIGTATAMGMEIPCVVLTDTKAGAKDVDISFGSAVNTAVSFDARDGGAITKADIDKVSGTITLPANPTWGDYTFAGWYTDKDGKGTAFTNSGLTNSVTVYAKWTKNGKAVRTEPLDLTGGTDLSGDGYTWDNTSKILTLSGAIIDCSGNAVSEETVYGIRLPLGATVELAKGTESIVVGGPATGDWGTSVGLYVWDENYHDTQTLTIKGAGTLNARGGDASGSSSYTHGINSSDNISITGVTINATGGEAIATSTRPEAASSGITSNETITIADGTTINAMGGTATANDSSEYEPSGYAQSFGLTCNTIIATGGNIKSVGNTVSYSHQGNRDSENETSLGVDAYTSITLSGTATVTAKGKTCAIQCDDGKNATNTDVITAVGATVTNGTADNGSFVSGTTKTLTQTDPNQPVKISFTKAVSFDARNGGAAIPSAEISEGGTITMPANPTWGDYTFAGWYTDKDGKGTAFTNSGLTNSVTVYAKWTKNGKAVRTEPLDLTGGTDLSGDGYAWNNTSKTLTLSGMTLNSSKLDGNNNARGIKFPTGTCTIILVDGTENTVDISAAKGSINNSQALFSENGLTIKTSGKGTPGKLNAIAGKATNPSFGIYSGGGIVIESGNITATAGESTSDNSVGISANESDIHIKGGTVVATGGKSSGISSGSTIFGSFGLYGANVQIDDGTVTATGGEATLSAGIVGAAKVKLNGGTITAKGKVAAVAALTSGVVIDDIANVKVNDNPAKVGNKSIGLTISTLLDASDAIVTDAAIKFKPSYTGTNPLAPNAPKATKTDTSITLPTQTITGETVEYGIEKNNSGTVTWQDEPTFSTLTADTGYKFYARVKENDNHKAGTTSDATEIKTKTAPTSVSVTVKDSGNNTLTSNVVVELKQGNNLIKKTDTANGGKYILEGIPEGVYSLAITKGIAPSAVTITETVTVKGTPVAVGEMKFLEGNKNTVVESKPGAPEVAVGGMNNLLTDAKLDATLTEGEKAAVDASGSVELKFKADVKTAGDVTADKDKIEGIAGGQKIDLLLDLSVLKTVKASDNTVITDGEKVTTLAGIIAVHLPIPAELQGKAGLAVYRMHGGKAEALGKDIGHAKDGEYYTIDPSGEFMTVYVKNFSTYALGYDAFAVTISGGGTGASGNGKYSNGETVTINAGSKSGYSFNGWTVTAGPVVLANPSSASTTFIMPAEAVTVTASWTSTGGGSTTTTYRNTVNQPENGTVTVTPASPAKGQTVTITTKPDAGYVVNTVTVKDANGKTIAVTEKGENSYTFVQPGSKATVEVTYKKAGTKTFTDVTANDWFYAAVMAATANGWFSGTSDTTFSPLTPTNRGMIATILHRMEGTPKANAASFDDVAANAYCANGIAWAEANSIVKGYGNGNYGPNDNITREQLAAILYRYAGYKGYDVSKTAALDSFADSKSVSGYAKEAMSWAVGSGLISGRGNNTLAPTATAARSEAAVILVRFEALFTK